MTTRRQFIKDMGLAAAGLSLGSTGSLFAHPLSSKEHQEARKDKVKIAYIGRSISRRSYFVCPWLGNISFLPWDKECGNAGEIFRQVCV